MSLIHLTDIYQEFYKCFGQVLEVLTSSPERFGCLRSVDQRSWISRYASDGDKLLKSSLRPNEECC